MTMTWSIVMPGVMDLCDEKVMVHFNYKGVIHCDSKGREHCDDRVIEQSDEKGHGTF